MTMFPQCQESILEYKYKGDKFNSVGVHAMGSSALSHIYSLLFHEM